MIKMEFVFMNAGLEQLEFPFVTKLNGHPSQ